MLKLITIIGARPQIIKAAAISRAIDSKFKNRISEIIVHTGQHYDNNMSQVFFSELGIPSPRYNLNVGSGQHGKQTAAMIAGIEEILLKEKPQALLVYGDTNSTLAGAIAASKLYIPVIHVEAGLRSFNKVMPEEVNRIMCDHVSTLLFSPTKTGYDNLLNEGFKAPDASLKPTINTPRIYHCGDIMYDNSIYFASLAEKKTRILTEQQLEAGKFILATIHRNNNTDDPVRLNALFSVLVRISREDDITVVIPLHPRTSKLLDKSLKAELLSAVKTSNRIKILPPASFLEMIVLEKNARIILTDSGGVQKEAFFFQKPCIILRSETEWIELVNCGAAALGDASEERILEIYTQFKNKKNISYPALFGDGQAATFICEQIVNNISSDPCC